MIPAFILSSAFSTINSIPYEVKHRRMVVFGKRMSVLRLEGVDFLIGVQIATLLKRETFNMYRSMKIKNIKIQRATPEQVEFLCLNNAVRPGTHSVTLIPYDSALYFIADALYRQQNSEENFFLADKKKLKTFFAQQPKLHRRKPLPWNVRRSIKKEELPNLSKKNFTFDLEINEEKKSPMESLLAAVGKLEGDSKGNYVSQSKSSFRLPAFVRQNAQQNNNILNCNQMIESKNTITLQALCSKFTITSC